MAEIIAFLFSINFSILHFFILHFAGFVSILPRSFARLSTVDFATPTCAQKFLETKKNPRCHTVTWEAW